MSHLNTFVHVSDADGVSHGFGPEDTVPGWAIKLITNPDVWAGEAPSEEPAPKPRTVRNQKSATK